MHLLGESVDVTQNERERDAVKAISVNIHNTNIRVYKL